MKNSKKFWDRMAGSYDKLNRKFDAQNKSSILIAKRYLEPGQRILDYACGTGTIAMELAVSAKQIVANDTSKKMLEVARQKIGDRKINNLELESADILSPVFDRMKFDMVLAFNILHYHKNIERVLDRIYELLSPGGFLISVTDCHGENRSVLSSLMQLLSGMGILPYMKYYKMTELEDEIQKHGFDTLEARNLYPQPPNYLIVSKKT